ncbi:MAG TPA: LuxR C-terminal-related transcriptional regulator [Herbaspirillum sp.]|nr:LuxR C-terminal-related transcriptional regulator [Herbaspirillum sp.]
MKALQQFIHFTEKFPGGVWGAKDTSSRCLYMNQAVRDLLRLPRDLELEGLLDSEVPHPIAEFEKELQAHDRLVEVTKEMKMSLEIQPYGKDQVLSAYFFEKHPFFNENNELIGTILHGYPALNLRLDRDRVNAGRIIFGVPNDILSQKEWDFVYFVMRGFSVKEMARLSGVSPGTIASRQNSVFNKLGIDTLAQLKQMAVAKGWDNYLPTSLLHNRHIGLW